MNVNSSSIFADIPEFLPAELCQTLVEKPVVRIERIVSRGHSSEADFWYDQPCAEWVILIKGKAKLAFFDGRDIVLTEGDYLLIPANCKHRVAWTSPAMDTVWLAIHIFEPLN